MPRAIADRKRMTSLVSRLNLPEAIALSLSVISPTVTAAFNITLIVQATGPAAPLTFAIGTLGMMLIAFSFIACTRRVAHAGSAYAYIAHTFGTRAGFVAGWTLLLTYLGFATGFAALVGSFSAAAFKGLSLEIGMHWITIGIAAMMVGWLLAFRDMRLSGWVMLALEGAAVVMIVALCIGILQQTHPAAAETAATLRPSAQFNGWSGLSYGMVYAVLCFAGFEGAATLGEETINPRRNIPIALLSTVLSSGVFFIFVAYCEVIGFGSAGIRDLAASQAPLNDLALRYMSPPLAIALDLAAATSCFCGVLGCLAAGGRVLFALGRAGLSPSLGSIHGRFRTPAVAVSVTVLLIIVPFLAVAPFTGAGDYYSYTSTIGVLALILVYIGVGAAETLEAWREGRSAWAALCLSGPALLLWVLYRNIYPAPDFPNNLWPYVALAWMASAWALMRARPAVAGAPLPDYS
jgi:amino acid transporter